ncbi:MAG TPA: hypothetical protein VFD21_00295, partial [Vicinamibacterales bacterium]|nr:hypothetical protein [Vicinamibacterales bacterium]
MRVEAHSVLGGGHDRVDAERTCISFDLANVSISKPVVVAENDFATNFVRPPQRLEETLRPCDTG